VRGAGETIAAVATGRGGAIAVVRVSGPDALAVCDGVFRGRVRLSDATGYTVHFGEVRDGERVLDQVLATVFRAPHSYTGEDAVEIACHASPYIENRLLQLLIAAGARMATAGEFTVRAFLAGKLDLAQAEAVADVIASGGRAQHTLAMNQLRGGVSSALDALRERLVHLAALLELELDFGEEDVEFASRDGLRALAVEIARELGALLATFALGNAIRSGVPVAIAGAPNAGKSTLLNALVGEERAMTSEIAGTTRDRIEARVNIGGVEFRLIDTAGLRDTDDVLERMGIERAREAVSRAWMVLLVVDASTASRDGIAAQIIELDLRPEQRLCVVLNKTDKIEETGKTDGSFTADSVTTVALSAKTGAGLDELRAWLAAAVDTDALEAGGAVVSGARHYEALTRAREAVERVLSGLGASETDGAGGTNRVTGGIYGTDEIGGADEVADGTDGTGGFDTILTSCLPADLLAEDVREILHHLGTITGSVTSEDILATIFSKFCIGK